MGDGITELDFGQDDYSDIVMRDSRYGARAYALLMQAFDNVLHDAHASGEEILDEFAELALDQYGPLTYTVLDEWGVHATEDVGEMMFNLVEGKRIKRDAGDSPESFAGGYDFKERFLMPYAP